MPGTSSRPKANTNVTALVPAAATFANSTWGIAAAKADHVGGWTAKKSSYRTRSTLRANRSGIGPRLMSRASHARPIAIATTVPAAPARRVAVDRSSTRSARPKSAPSARARNNRPTQSPASAPASMSPRAARPYARKNSVPRTAAGANASRLTHPGANAPPRPATPAATSAAFALPPSDRAARYATTGISREDRISMACAARKLSTNGSRVIPMDCSTVASGIQKRWLATGTAPPGAASRKFQMKSAVSPLPAARRRATPA